MRKARGEMRNAIHLGSPSAPRFWEAQGAMQGRRAKGGAGRWEGEETEKLQKVAR